MSEEEPHLWEVDHPYYCEESNYFANESMASKYRSWPDFLKEQGDSDFDMNLVFRWDWQEIDGDGEPTFNGDVNYRNGTLKIFWMGQRKGIYRWSTIEVCRADEPSIKAWLALRWNHLVTLWLPISEARTALEP